MLPSIIPVHHPVLDGFGDVGGADIFISGQVGDGACDLENPALGGVVCSPIGLTKRPKNYAV